MKDTAPFLNRLRKNFRHWGKWARKRGIQCYRLYDRDIPEFPLAVDLYGDRAHLQEYWRGGEADARDRGAWIAAIREAAAQALEMPASRMVIKRRERQRGTDQYEKTGARGEDFVVAEGGHRFVVNLEAYLDTGLFLDHRLTRAMVGERAAGRRFLNLFCYTGSFTVYAAAGGATESLSVDLSNTYLDWAKRNLQLNGLDPGRHRLLRADATPFLADASGRGERFDLIVLDPPSFSNSKRMRNLLDVQRDHPALIAGCMALLAPGGELFFSTNLRRFRPDADALSSWQVENISERTIPEDFRNRRIHHCYRVTRRVASAGRV
ncbi:MAG: class I SAM-dependent methyltransferase [Betaproteobacteria bacterium]|nr:class I SAM-dependent methyltransferase [Betaproteobacteria bacterium]